MTDCSLSQVCVCVCDWRNRVINRWRKAGDVEHAGTHLAVLLLKGERIQQSVAAFLFLNHSCVCAWCEFDWHSFFLLSKSCLLPSLSACHPSFLLIGTFFFWTKTQSVNMWAGDSYFKTKIEDDGRRKKGSRGRKFGWRFCSLAHLSLCFSFFSSQHLVFVLFFARIPIFFPFQNGTYQQ